MDLDERCPMEYGTLSSSQLSVKLRTQPKSMTESRQSCTCQQEGTVTGFLRLAVTIFDCSLRCPMSCAPLLQWCHRLLFIFYLHAKIEISKTQRNEIHNHYIKKQPLEGRPKQCSPVTPVPKRLRQKD